MILCYCVAMKILGIDYGTKRIGLALSDETAKFAIPFLVVKNSDNLVQEIVELAEKNLVKEIVLGESRDYEGKPNYILAKSLELKKELEGKGFTVHLEPEFMTSAHAEKLQGKHDLIDASAAALILQSFIDRIK